MRIKSLIISAFAEGMVISIRSIDPSQFSDVELMVKEIAGWILLPGYHVLPSELVGAYPGLVLSILFWAWVIDRAQVNLEKRARAKSTVSP